MIGPSSRPHLDERGITSIETAIVLIAFVVVASVFAFTMLSTGTVATEKTRESVLGGLGEATATLLLRGSVVAIANASSPAFVEYVTLQIANASRDGDGVEISAASTVVSYVDSEQQTNLAFTTTPTATAGWGTNWLVGNSPLLKPGERVEITVNLTGLGTPLPARREFTIEIRPSRGPVLVVNRTTPAELTGAIDLK